MDDKFPGWYPYARQRGLTGLWILRFLDWQARALIWLEEHEQPPGMARLEKMIRHAEQDKYIIERERNKRGR